MGPWGRGEERGSWKPPLGRAHTRARAHRGQKRYRISRKGPTKSCQVAFRLTFRVTASTARERTTRAKYTGYPARRSTGAAEEGGRGEERIFSPLPLLPLFRGVLFLFLGVVSLGSRWRKRRRGGG